jgi:hypothetical protein
MTYQEISNQLTNKVVGLILLAMAGLFTYFPAQIFIESHLTEKVINPSQKMDLDSLIQVAGDDKEMSQAVFKIMAKPEVEKVYVRKGSSDYPVFEIMRGKNSHVREIKSSVHSKYNDYSIWIYYSTAEESQDLSLSIMATGSFLFGIAAAFLGVFFLATDRREDKQTGNESEQKPAISVEPPTPKPVHYEGLKLVK